MRPSYFPFPSPEGGEKTRLGGKLRREEQLISRTGTCMDRVGTVDDMSEGVLRMPFPLAPARPETQRRRGHFQHPQSTADSYVPSSPPPTLVNKAPTPQAFSLEKNIGRDEREILAPVAYITLKKLCTWPFQTIANRADRTARHVSPLPRQAVSSMGR
jgi:hypothetical protein